jgi:4,5-DOPA dioxygenase extradiol
MTKAQSQAAAMPVVFFAHGSPTVIRENNNVTRAWRAIAQSMPTPKAILMVSAHWLTRGTAVTAMRNPRTIHDFGRGLGADLFDYQYRPPGAPWLAERVAELLQPEIAVHMDESWGLDHGTWSVLLKAFPEADVPVVQLSINTELAPAEHARVGERLKVLRQEGVLVAASGNIVHNLQLMDWSPEATPYDWASAFNEHIKAAIIARNLNQLADPWSQEESASLSLPTDEHYLPLLYAFGASDENDSVHFAPDFVQYRSLSMTSVLWSTEGSVVRN